MSQNFDARSLALSPASKRILSRLGVWDQLQKYTTPIEKIHVSNQNHFGVSRLGAEENNALGYVIEMQHINQVLYQALDPNQIMAPATLSGLNLEDQQASISTESGQINIKAKLIVAADGAESKVRDLCNLPSSIKDYQQQAIVANVGLMKPHGYCAYERFTQNGLLALLPLADQRMSLVWTMPPDKAERMMKLSASDFLKELQIVFGYKLGRFLKLGERATYPLKQVLMPQQANWPVIFVGNAAHSLHPVAGQGFNLGLRDVATLSQCIAKSGLNAQMLEEYLKLRIHDQKAIQFLTDGLISVFKNKLPGAGLVRGLGLMAFDQTPVLKNLLARYARGFGGIIPDLVCEIGER